MSDADKKQKIPLKILQKSDTEISLQDVYGGKEFKTKLEDIILPMQNNMVYACMGVDIPKSFLFYGPPGTGKTYTATAIGQSLANQTEKKVGFMKYDIGTMGTAYINMGSVNMQYFFDSGKAILEQVPDIEHIIYFFDEIDSLLSHRGSINQSKEDNKLCETFMKNLQYINDRGENEIIIGATNFLDGLDTASIRSGRFNEKLEFKLPDEEHRTALISNYLEAQNKRVGYKVFRKYNVEELVSISNNFNCADVDLCIKNSLKEKIRQELRNKPKGIIPAWYVTQKGLKEEFEKLKLSKSPSKKRIGFMVD